VRIAAPRTVHIRHEDHFVNLVVRHVLAHALQHVRNLGGAHVAARAGGA
jgi:hypothetical protein